MVGFILLFGKGKENLLELAILHGALTKLWSRGEYYWGINGIAVETIVFELGAITHEVAVETIVVEVGAITHEVAV